MFHLSALERYLRSRGALRRPEALRIADTGTVSICRVLGRLCLFARISTQGSSGTASTSILAGRAVDEEQPETVSKSTKYCMTSSKEKPPYTITGVSTAFSQN
jgi:hypothetical protein